MELSCEMTAEVVKSGMIDACPLVILDGGAAQGFDPRWNKFDPVCIRIGIEPDAEECERLRNAPAAAEFPGRYHILQTALWSSDCKKILHITGDPDSSSFFKSNHRYIDRLPDQEPLATRSSIEVEAKALDNIPLPIPGGLDVIKLDIQGAELDALRGGEGIIRKGVLAVIIEVAFVQIYENAPLFSDIDVFMRNLGFSLFDIDLRRWQRRHLAKTFDRLRVGQVTWADVLYMRDPTVGGAMPCSADQRRNKFIKLACLYEFFSMPDCAADLLDFASEQTLLKESDLRTLRRALSKNVITAFNNRSQRPGPEWRPSTETA